nr:reverse transcriptase domain-containing protein [Tanacetum cinerariifolium]
GSPRADDHEHLELPEMLKDPYVEVALQALPSPDYILGPEEPEQAPPSPDYDASPTAQPPEYVPESDLEAHPEDDDDEDPEEDPVDYPADGGDDGDDEEGSSEDDDMDIETDEEEEEEHPTPTDSVVVALIAVDQAPSAEETEPFKTDESDAPSSGTPLLLPISASTSSPPLQPPSASRREDRPEVTLPPQKKLGISLSPGYEVGESSSAAAARPAGGLRADYGFFATMDREIMCDPEREVGYGITDSWDEIVEPLQGAPVSTDTELGEYMREFETRVKQDTEEIYMRLDDEQKASDLVCGEVKSLRTTVLGQMIEIRELHVADRRRQIVILEMLRADHRRSTEIIGLRTALQGQGLAGGLTQPELQEEADHETINATSVTNAQLQEMIDQGVTAALAARDALISTNGDDSHNSGTGDLKVKGTDLASYTQRYQELALLCGRMFSEESDKIEKYIGGLSDMIHGSVVASKPKTMQETVEIATELMDKKICTFAERETASKRKFENTSRNTQNQQQQSNKRQNTGQVYTAASGEKKQYGGSKPLCAKCNYHHDGPCALKCLNYNKISHFARDCRNTPNTNNANNQRGTGLGQKTTCYECRVQGHFKRECPKLKNNNNHGNKGGRNNAPARVYAVGRAGMDPDVNVATGTFLLNNRYASVLFDTGADKSFVSTTFSTQINITPSTLDHCYDVELADGRIIGLNTILRGCTSNLLNHPFNINLIPIELGSFDAIIGIDWLEKYQAVIACAEKIVRIPLETKP